MIAEQLAVTAEGAASFLAGRSTLIVPMSKSRSEPEVGSVIAVLEPYMVADRPLFAADYGPSYGWQPAYDMPIEMARIWLQVGRVRLLSDAEISDADMLADGVYRVGQRFAWQRISGPTLHGSARSAWQASQRACWGVSGRPGRQFVLRVTASIRKAA